MRVARRVACLPPYLFAELDRKVAAKRQEGVDVISLGVGDPDLPTPRHVVEALQEAAEDAATHQYPSYYGLPALRLAVAEWYERRFGVELDPDTEVLPLIGSKEGLAHLSFAMIDPGDAALVPDPGYAVYSIGTALAGGTPVPVALEAGRRFIPDLEALSPPAATKVLWLNYPSNPTAAVAEPDFFDRAVDFARRHDLLLCHDAAYSEITFDGFVAPSVLQSAGAKDVAVEFGSLSKTYNMTGWRVGFVVGNPRAIGALATLKTNLDSWIFNALQRAAVAALTGSQDHVEQMRAVYQKRRDVVVSAFQEIGIPVEPPLGSIYVWVPTPDGRSGEDFASDLLDEAGVVVTPGTGFGRQGEGFVRISLTVADARLQEAVDRIRRRLG
ncbi:MAG: aminotransferase class I/II-fold pyridoxal phosphate-dependent enzyme [Actinobacteria bacterium]|nr:MAG: aminotransferase class I/II-fold pyridoxal phosphate-dependent enzyme [Actinomycetota bacterium]